MSENAEIAAVSPQTGDLARAEMYKEEANEYFKSMFTRDRHDACRSFPRINETRLDQA